MDYEKDDDDSLIINEEEVKIVRKIFCDYTAGFGIFKIAKAFNYV